MVRARIALYIPLSYTTLIYIYISPHSSYDLDFQSISDHINILSLSRSMDANVGTGQAD
jgi:hypothetical protein